MRPPFGRPITAREIEEFTSHQDEVGFVRLANATVASALADVLPSAVLPACSERVNVPNGGVDAELILTVDIALPEHHGLVGPGWAVYQFKWRDIAARKRTEILRQLSRSITTELARLREKGGPLPDRFVLLMSIHLTAPQTRQMRKAILTGCPEFSGRPIVIWGAGELAAHLNTHPRVRHAFFSEGTFCTLGIAVQELENHYRGFPWIDIIGRDPQIKAIREFVTRRADRVLLITGLPYVGKTRTVLEALAPLGGRVVWASHAEVVTEDHLRDLDQELNAVLVLDNCEGDVIERALRWAMSRSHLQTILIGRQGRDWPGVSTLFIDRLDDPDARKLLTLIAPNLPSLQETWLNRLVGGLPGLAIYATGQVVADKDLTGPAEDAKDFSRTLGRLISQRVLAGTTAEERRALHVVSLLMQIGIKDSAYGELDAVCQCLGYEVSEIRSVLPGLVEKDVVVERGRFVEVVPPLLAETLAAEPIMGRPLVLRRLLLGLEAGARLRFLARLRNIGGSEEVDRALESIYAPDGWFPDLESLLLRAREFHALAPRHPRGAAACLYRLLSGLPASTLRTKVIGTARREIVWALSDLSLRQDTFHEAAEVLLCLAEGESEEWANNATGVFRNIFHPLHWEVACPLPERLQFLTLAAKSGSPERRRLVASAVGHSASLGGSYLLHHPEGPRSPDAPGWPRTDEERRTYFGCLLDLLGALSRDADQGVRVEARSRLIARCREFVRMAMSEEDGAAIVDKTFSLLKEISEQAKEVEVIAEIRSQLEMLLQEIGASGVKPPEEIRLTESVEEVRQKASCFLSELTGDSFASRMKRWAGPRSWQDEIADVSAPEGELSRSQKALKQLADEAIQHPNLLDDSLLNWLLGQEAQHGASMFLRLGECDTGGVWREQLIQRIGFLRGPEAFGSYLCGWARRDRRGAEDILDGLLEIQPESAEGVLSATLRIGAGPSVVDRILRLIEGKKLRKEILAKLLAWDWTNLLTPQDFVRLVRGLEDGSSETGLALLDILAHRQRKTGELPEEMRSTVWQLLERTASTRTIGQAHRWDQLAAFLAASDPTGVLDLIERVARQEVRPSGRPVLEFLMERASAWKVLARINRPALVKRFLSISMASENVPPWVHLCARQLIDPSQDGGTLLEFARNYGEAGALTVADLLDASKPGFWELIREIVATYGDSKPVMSRVQTWISLGHGWGSPAPLLKKRREQVARLAEDPDPRVSRWAREVARDLEGDVKREERRDEEDFLWDYDVKRPELIEMLQDKQSPDRLWAIQRILLHAPREEAIRLLTVDEIQEALPHVELPDRVRRIWEAYVANWSHRG